MLNTLPFSMLTQLPEPVLSVYLDTNPVRHVNRNSEHGYISWFRSQSKQLLGNLGESERSRLSVELRRVEQFLEQAPQSYRGLAIFAAPGIWQALELRTEPRNELRWGRPALWQLLVMADDFTPSCVAAINGLGVQVFMFRHGTLVPVETLEFRPDPAQWKQMSAFHSAERGAGISYGLQHDLFERRRESQFLRLLGQAAHRISSACEAHKSDRVVLWGPGSHVRFIERKINSPLRFSVTCIPHVWSGDDLAGAAALVAESLNRLQVSRQQSRAGELLNRDPGIVTGAEETLALLQRGRLASMLVAEDFNPILRHCPTCNHAVVSSPGTCTRCGGEQVEVRLQDVLPQLLVTHSCEGEVVSGAVAERLGTCGSIGGWLRRRAPAEALPYSAEKSALSSHSVPAQSHG